MNSSCKISIQPADFNLAEEVALLEESNIEDGAVVTFTGRVRNKNLGQEVTTLTLEHYPGMTEKSLEKVIDNARERWQLGRITVIHRIGELTLGEQIVFVGVTSKHRKDAFCAAEFIMDFLKVDAPFWKKESTANGDNWLDARNSDVDKAKQWQK